MSDNSTIEQIAENIANKIQSSQPEGDLHLIPTLLVILLGSLILYLFQSKTIISSKNPTLPYIKNIGKDNAIFTLNPSYKNIIQKLQIELIPSKEGEKTITLDLDKNHKSKPAKIHKGISYAMRFRTQTHTSIKWSWWSNDHFLVEDPPYELIHNPQQEDLQQMRAELQEARTCNFLLLGKVGIGKSSLVNTFLTAYNGVIHQDATTSNSDSSVTEKIEIHPIVPGRLNVLDFVGLEKGYAFDFIPEIVKGKCENITRANMRTKEFIFGTPGGPTQVDTVIFVIAADSFNDDKEVNRNILEQLQKSRKQIIKIFR